jgi:hypothetical protein
MVRLVLTSKPAASQASNCKAAPNSLPPVTTTLHLRTGGAASGHRSAPCVSPALPQPARGPLKAWFPGAPTHSLTPQLCHGQQPHEPWFNGEPPSFQARVCRNRPCPGRKAGPWRGCSRGWQAGWVAGVAERGSSASKRGCACSCWGRREYVRGSSSRSSHMSVSLLGRWGVGRTVLPLSTASGGPTLEPVVCRW